MDRTRDQITALVFRAVEEVNEDLVDGAKLEKEFDTILFGRGATIDSMTLVSFIVAVEEQLLDAFGLAVTLANEKAMSMERSPFRTMASMVAYVEDVVGNAEDD